MSTPSPLSVMDFYRAKGLDLTCDQILAMIKELGPGTTVEKVVDVADEEGISSRATTFKKLKALEKAGFISSIIPEDDQRYRLLAVSRKGRDRLQGWGR